MKILNPQILQDFQSHNPININIGSGHSKIDGFYNLDIIELPGVDIIADINTPLSEIPDNSVSCIYARHTMEHVYKFIELMDEIHRILVPGATLKITVPHFSNPYYYSDPTHVRPFGLYTMHYFMDESDQIGKKLPNYYTNTRFSLKQIKYDFYRESILEKLLVPLIRPLVNLNFTTQSIFEKRFVWFWPPSELRFILIAKK